MSVRKHVYYPLHEPSETVQKIKITIGDKSVLLVKYEREKRINLYVGGHEKWCIHCELIKDGPLVKPIGYLIKIRYDLACSLDSHFSRGHDIRQMLRFIIKYIHTTYPAVKELSFNDLSTKTCDDETDVNLAVMTYLYAGQTWYEKHFGAHTSPQSASGMAQSVSRVQEAKQIPWSEMKEVIQNRGTLPFREEELEELYTNAETWQGFFKPILRRIQIADFCIFISGWLDSFILRYFNTLQGFTFLLPVKDNDNLYEEGTYLRGGRTFTKKVTRKRSKDYH